MSRVIVTKSKLDELAKAIGVKTQRRLPLTIEEMKDSVEGIELPNLQAVTVDPSESQLVIEPDSQHNGLSSVTVNAAPLEVRTATKDTASVTVYTPSSGYYGMKSVTVSVPAASLTRGMTAVYTTQSSVRKWAARGYTSTTGRGIIGTGLVYGPYQYYNAVPSGTTVTPTTSSQTIGGRDYMMEGPVTVAAVPSYQGPNEATPTWGEQSFDTDGKMMSDDFTVHSILELEVANDAGGLTLTI